MVCKTEFLHSRNPHQKRDTRRLSSDLQTHIHTQTHQIKENTTQYKGNPSSNWSQATALLHSQGRVHSCLCPAQWMLLTVQGIRCSTGDTYHFGTEEITSQVKVRCLLLMKLEVGPERIRHLTGHLITSLSKAWACLMECKIHHTTQLTPSATQ